MTPRPDDPTSRPSRPQRSPQTARSGGEYVPLPQQRRRRSGRFRKVVAALLVCAIVAASGLMWATSQISPSGGQGAAVDRLVIPKGATSADIARLLADADVIAGPSVFGYYSRLKGAGGWKAGEYVGFRRNSSYDQAIEVLDDGPVPPRASVVRVTEGKRLVD
ncbi:MAG: hypothetical protein ACKOYM_03330, partial [Actinomycetes bacterium]